MKSPLIMLADNLRMPAMLVAKNVLEEHINEEKLKNQMEEHYRNYNLYTDNNATLSRQDIYVTKSLDSELDSTANVDVQLSQSLNWLSNKLISMRKVSSPTDLQDESNNSFINNHSYYNPKTTKYATPHQLANSTWLIRTDPLLAYQVFKCSVIDGYYGSCVEFIKSCTGRRYEQILEENINFITTGTKANSIDGSASYITEKECRLRGLDMTPDTVLNEPIAVSLSDTNNDMNDNDEYTATNYIGKNDKEIRVLNWIESKAMFGGPDQLRTYMPRQLFPYWNRYGPGAVIFWFGHILEDGEEDKVVHRGVSINKTTYERSALSRFHNKTVYDESSAFSFWSKYCLLMDGFPESSRVLQYNYN
ncbi:Hypothetical protein CINCED_3A013367 [Cinara cedri]|nr:Hypothetical protein CINCED_3A013367 [Cinara cedri]